MSRVRVVVSDDKKERWSEYVDKTPEYDSLSDLVRKSVEREVQTETTSEGGGQYEEIYEIMEQLESIKKEQAHLKDSVDAHRQNALGEENIEELEAIIGEALWDYADMIRGLGGDSNEE